jgi:uncharacterized membrane protein
MNKMLVAVFNNESAAYEGLSALKDLHRDGDISLYATAVVAKDRLGVVSVKQTADEGPVGTALGMLTGSVVGLLGGPVGLAAGATAGGLTGVLYDLNKTGVDVDFVDEVSKVLLPGKAAVIADVEETWITPVNTKIHQLGGLVFRRQRSAVVEDQLARDSAAFKAEWKQLKDELAQGNAADRAAIQQEIDAEKKRIEAMQSKAKERASQIKSDTDAKVASLKVQMKQAGAQQQAKIEQRIAELQADYAARNAKLQQAQELTREALIG